MITIRERVKFEQFSATASSYAKSGANQSTLPKPGGFDGYTNKDGDHEYLKMPFLKALLI